MRYKPMLAHPVGGYERINDEDWPLYSQYKLDGVRCLIQCEDFQHHGKVIKAYSRTGKEWKNIRHILEQLRPFFFKYPNVVLDGELYNHKFKDDFEQIISMVRKTKPTDEDRSISRENVQFHCYDIIDEELPFDQRIEFVMNELRDSASVRTVETLQTDEANAHFIHTMNKENGYEGSIVRTNDVYKYGRSWSLRKFKDFHDAEANIVGYDEGKGKRKGTLGKFVMQDDDGNQFGCPPGKGHNYKDLARMLENIHEYMGQRATFTYFERTKAGSYRHPLFKCIRNYE